MWTVFIMKFRAWIFLIFDSSDEFVASIEEVMLETDLACVCNGKIRYDTFTKHFLFGQISRWSQILTGSFYCLPFTEVSWNFWCMSFSVWVPIRWANCNEKESIDIENNACTIIPDHCVAPKKRNIHRKYSPRAFERFPNLIGVLPSLFSYSWIHTLFLLLRNCGRQKCYHTHSILLLNLNNLTSNLSCWSPARWSKYSNFVDF